MEQTLQLSRVADFANNIGQKCSELLILATKNPNDISTFSNKFVQLYSELFCFAEGSTSYSGYKLPTALGDGAISNINSLLSELYQTRFACLSYGGSSGALLTLMTAVLPKLHPNRKVIIFDELSHQSLNGGLLFGRWQAVKIPRNFYSHHDTYSPLRLRDIQRCVEAVGAESIAACVIVNPSYCGFRNHSSCEQEIFSYLQSLNITLVNDGAWGPMAIRGNAAGAELLNQCSDVNITSLHKRGITGSLGCMTTNRDDIAKHWDVALDLGFRSTSPSFVCAMVAEHRLAQLLNGDWDEKIAQITRRSNDLRRRINEVHEDIYIVTPEMVGADFGDPAHVLISTSSLPIDARLWGHMLSDEYGIQVEKVTKKSMLLLMGTPISNDDLDFTIKSLQSSLATLLSKSNYKTAKRKNHE